MDMMKEIKDIVAKEKIGESNTYLPIHSTGIDIFDYINSIVRMDGTIDIGHTGGRPVMVIGESGSGKTAFLIKQACHIADTYKDSTVIHLDYERSSTKERILQISKWSEQKFEDKYLLLNKKISVESIYRLVKALEKTKMEKYEEIKIDTGKVDINGEKIFILPPTVLLVDSIAMLAPEDIENEDELKGQAGAASIAKSNTNVFKRITGPLDNANILMLNVNHITKKIEMNRFAATKSQVNYLKQDESIPGK